MQESYDNSGLITGSPDLEIKAVLVSLDCTEAIVEEAIGLPMSLSHHPIVLKAWNHWPAKIMLNAPLSKDSEQYFDCVMPYQSRQYNKWRKWKNSSKIGLKILKYCHPRSKRLRNWVLRTRKSPGNGKQSYPWIGAGQIGKYRRLCLPGKRQWYIYTGWGSRSI